MAKQNFLSGGYYGKLGATVGQRWKNKRTIRTYVVPTNPRTEKQQANRNKFADAVTFSQMGLQMNYYATCFENVNFTKWNCRMQTSRYLKESGLQGLDLIPLYPATFVPPTLLTEITIDELIDATHISFSVPDLTDANNRTLSLMFALYDNNNVFLGYKLYIGEYDATKPGYITVEVDDTSEITTNCYVRIVSNDDEDSVTDLIASPRLKVRGSSPDIRAFNTVITSITKNQSGFNIIFAEPYRGVGAVATFTGEVRCVVKGGLTDILVSGASITNTNGYCSVFVSYPTTVNEDLPAFPNNSWVDITNIEYSGASWEYTANNVVSFYDDNDLNRTYETPLQFFTDINKYIQFRMAFNELIDETSITLDTCVGGRFDDTSLVSIPYEVLFNNGYLYFNSTGTYKNFPMYRASDKIYWTNRNFVVNGVTYNVPAQEIQGVNNTKISSYLTKLTPIRTLDASESGGYYEVSGLTVVFEDLVVNNDTSYTVDWMESIIDTEKHIFVTPLSQGAELYYYSGEDMGILEFSANFDGASGADDLPTNSTVNGGSVNTISYDGINYDLTTICPTTTLANFED